MVKIRLSPCRQLAFAVSRAVSVMSRMEQPLDLCAFELDDASNKVAYATTLA